MAINPPDLIHSSLQKDTNQKQAPNEGLSNEQWQTGNFERGALSL